MNGLLIAGQTDVGQRRNDNQDTFICTALWAETNALLAVVDGVGGYAGGGEAAAIAKESISQYMTRPNGKLLTMLREAVVFANNRINEQRQHDLKLMQMCCVLTTAVADAEAEKLYFVHVGDTRLYRYRQSVLEKLTHDHSLVGVREDANELTEAEAMQHPRRNEILREVGSTDHRVDDADFLEWGEADFRPGDYLLLCSDGLTDMITQAQIRSVLDQPLTLEEQITELIRLANEAGGNDNITVVLAKHNVPTDELAPIATPALTEPILPKAEPVLVTSQVDRVERPAAVPVAKKSPVGLWFIMALVLVGLIGGIIWYQSQTYEATDLMADSLRTAGPQADSVMNVAPARSGLDSLLQAAYRSSDHRLLLTIDTLRIAAPLVLTDSLQAILGSTPLTVVVPVDTLRAQVAIRITRPGSTTLGNLIISGFRTGIETENAGPLRLSNVYFRAVDVPISAAIRQDTFRNGTVAVSVQNQSVQPQPSRP